MTDVMNVDTSGILALEEIHKKLLSHGIEVRHRSVSNISAGCILSLIGFYRFLRYIYTSVFDSS